MKTNIYHRFLLFFFLFYSLNAYNQIFSLSENDTSFYQILHKMESFFSDSSNILEEGEFISGESEEDLFLLKDQVYIVMLREAMELLEVTMQLR